LKASREEIFDALQGEITESHRFVLRELLQHIEELEACIARFDAYLLAGLESERPVLALLQTIPGIDLIGAALLIVEIGADMSVFGSADRLASWVGICPGNHESAGKRKSGRVRKGNPYVRRVLCEFAHAASRTRSVFQAKFRALVVRRGHKRAIVAIAHKILRTLFFMLLRCEHFRDSAVDYEALSVQRNAPRWIKALTQFGFLTPANA
jgi:transposase